MSSLENVVVVLLITKLAGVNSDYHQTLRDVLFKLVQSRQNVHTVYTAVRKEVQ